jgi:hypothetical protein
MIASWQAPLSSGKSSEELLVSYDEGRERRVLILPALFDEANKLRRLTVQVMRQLDLSGVDSFLPDMPGVNESLAPLSSQTLMGWRSQVNAAAKSVSATHFLSIRAGALMAPSDLPGWHYAPQTGAKVLRAMIRARTIAAREDGREESSEQLLETGRREGLTLAGWTIGGEMFRELETAEPIAVGAAATIAQKELGGAGLWLRAEPDEDDAQAAVLANNIAGQGTET